MEKKKDELQSRRDFFKKAVKTALPILGMAIVASTPLKLFASQSDSSGCNYSCTLGCTNLCTSCTGNCEGSCETTCRGGAKVLVVDTAQVHVVAYVVGEVIFNQ